MLSLKLIATVNKKPNAILFLYEGDTEGGFYDRLFELFELNRQVQIKKKCINGVYSINNKVRKAIDSYLENGKNDHVTFLNVIVAYDREKNREEIDSRIDKDLISDAVDDKRLKDNCDSDVRELVLYRHRWYLLIS